MPEPQDRRRRAVAMRYDHAQEEAPRVVAKGHGETAERILELAAEAGVPIKEDPALVDVLVRIDLDTTIPAELYQALADVLVWAYAQDEELRRRRLGALRDGPVDPRPLT